MRSNCLRSLYIFIFCCLVAIKASPEARIISDSYAVENAYLERVFVKNLIWSPRLPLDFLLAAVLDSNDNITEEEKEKSQILQAFALAIEMNHHEALNQLFFVYEGQDLPYENLLNPLIRASRRSYYVAFYLIGDQKQVFSKNRAEVEKFFLLAIQAGEQKVAKTLRFLINSTDILRQGFYMAAHLGHDEIGIDMLNSVSRRLSSDEFNIAFQLAYNKSENSRLAETIKVKCNATSYQGILPEIPKVEGHLPSDTPDSSAEYHFYKSLYDAGFGRFVVKLSERNPSFLHEIVIKKVAKEADGVSLHAALQVIASHLKDDNGQTIDIVPFMLACKEGFDDIVDAYAQDSRMKQYAHLPYFTYICLSQAIETKKDDLLIKLLATSIFEAPTLSSSLQLAVSKGYLDIVEILLSAGADPVGNEDEFFKEACDKGHADLIWFLLDIPQVRKHELTPKILGTYLLGINDIDRMRNLFLGESPDLIFDPLSLREAIIKRYESGLESFFKDPELLALLAHHHDQKKIRTVFGSSAVKLHIATLNSFLKNLDLFDPSFGEFTLRSNIVMITAAHAYGRQKEMVMALVNDPRRSRRDRYRLQIRLLQRYSSDEYVTEELLSEIRSSPLLLEHLKYYLPSESLHLLFPNNDIWNTDSFLKEVDKSDRNHYALNRDGKKMENVLMLLFFDKSAGLFGTEDISGGESFWYDTKYIDLVSAMEASRPLPPTPQWNRFKEHLSQVAKMGKVYDENKKLPARILLKEKLSNLNQDDTYLLSVNGPQHTGYALATKKNNSHLNIKVFNSYHHIVEFDEARRRAPYIEWDDLPLEEVIPVPFQALNSREFVLSDTRKPQLPKNLPLHMKTKGQRIGSCPGFKVWLVARFDLETLPRFLEFSVAFHLWFVEDLAANFEDRMKEWNAKLTRGWFAITRTPHFEGQLLKDIRDIEMEDPEMCAKLRAQIIESVQRRYRLLYPDRNWDDEQVVLDFIHWKEKYLATIPDVKGQIETTNSS